MHPPAIGMVFSGGIGLIVDTYIHLVPVQVTGSGPRHAMDQE